jgi:hypothetical protein
VAEALWLRHSQSAPDDELSRFADTLLQCLADVSLPAVIITQCLKCMCAVVAAFATRPQCAANQRRLFTAIWNMGIRLVGAHQGQSVAFSLLRQLLCNGLVGELRNNVWAVFQSSICDASNDAVLFLTACLSHCHIPENFQINSMLACTNASQQSTPYLLRSQLIDWLLPSQSSNFKSNLTSDFTDSGDAANLVHVLVQLSRRESLPISKLETSASCHCLSCVELKKTNTPVVSSLEQSLLDCALVITKAEQNTTWPLTLVVPGQSLETVICKIFACLKSSTAYLLGINKDDSENYDEVV